MQFEDRRLCEVDMESSEEQYAEFLRLRPSFEREALFLIDAMPPEPIAAAIYYQSLAPQYNWTPAIWSAFLQNARKLSKVRRIRGGPYAVHPTRMALMATHLLGRQKSKIHSLLDECTEMTTILCLVHDYLEEGGGISRSSFDLFKNELPQQPLAWYGAVALSEPPLDYASIDPNHPFVVRDAAYLLQLAMILRSLPDTSARRSLANASLLDKLDNLHDFDYITRIHDEERRNQKLARKIAYYSAALSLARTTASPHISGLMQYAISTRTKSFGLSENQISRAKFQLEEVRKRYAQTIIPAIEETQASLHLSELAREFV
jgi:hypothetical protein